MDVVGRERLNELVASVVGRPTWCGVYARPVRAQEGYDRAMRRLWMAVGLVLIGAGLVWVAQGLNLIFAPRSFASMTHWNPTGWHSAMFEPWMTMQSEFCRSC